MLRADDELIKLQTAFSRLDRRMEGLEHRMGILDKINRQIAGKIIKFLAEREEDENVTR